MGRLTRCGALGAAFVVALGLGPLRAQEQPKPGPIKTVKKSGVEEMVARGYKRCQDTDEVLQRATICPNDGTTMIVAEYAGGDVGIFVGDDDPKQDCFGVITAKNLPLLREALGRVK